MTLVYFDPNGLIRDIPVENSAICVSSNVIFNIQFLDFSIVICHYLRYFDPNGLRESSFNMTRGGGGDEDIETRSLKF